jgi:hypothetical protein
VRPGEPELMAMAQQLVANPLVRTSCPAPRRLYGGGRPLLPMVACVSAVVLTTAALSIAGPVLGTKHLLMGYLLPATVIAIFLEHHLRSLHLLPALLQLRSFWFLLNLVSRLRIPQTSLNWDSLCCLRWSRAKPSLPFSMRAFEASVPCYGRRG